MDEVSIIGIDLAERSYWLQRPGPAPRDQGSEAGPDAGEAGEAGRGGARQSTAYNARTRGVAPRSPSGR